MDDDKLFIDTHHFSSIDALWKGLLEAQTLKDPCILEFTVN